MVVPFFYERAMENVETVEAVPNVIDFLTVRQNKIETIARRLFILDNFNGDWQELNDTQKEVYRTFADKRIGWKL